MPAALLEVPAALVSAFSGTASKVAQPVAAGTDGGKTNIGNNEKFSLFRYKNKTALLKTQRDNPCIEKNEKRYKKGVTSRNTEFA